MRVLDVSSGQVLPDAVRERSAGGYFAIMTATYPNDLTADVAGVLAAERQGTPDRRLLPCREGSRSLVRQASAGKR